MPAIPDEAVEIPAVTKRRLGLDEARSWIVVTQANRFAWPGPDIRPIAAGRFEYGFLPPVLFRKVQERFLAVFNASRQSIVRRTE